MHRKMMADDNILFIFTYTHIETVIFFKITLVYQGSTKLHDGFAVK